LHFEVYEKYTNIKTEYDILFPPKPTAQSRLNKRVEAAAKKKEINMMDKENRLESHSVSHKSKGRKSGSEIQLSTAVSTTNKKKK